MIKKTTKIIFKEAGTETSQNLIGGMPLSKGEIVHLKRKDLEVTDYLVVDKIIDCVENGQDWAVDVTYVLKKR